VGLLPLHCQLPVKLLKGNMKSNSMKPHWPRDSCFIRTYRWASIRQWTYTCLSTRLKEKQFNHFSSWMHFQSEFPNNFLHFWRADNFHLFTGYSKCELAITSYSFRLLYYLTLPNFYHILTNSYKPGLFTILASSPYDTVCPGPIFFAKANQTLSWNEPANYNKWSDREHSALLYFKNNMIGTVMMLLH
jgi:hypothetical protein